MLRAATSNVARRAVLRSASGTPAVPRASVAFHTSSRKDEEAKEEGAAPPAPSKGGLFGTGLSEWFALPIGITAAVPLIKLDWYVVNEETQLAAVFIAFCVALYSQGGDAIYKSLDATAQGILKDHHEAEDKVIAALEQKVEFLKANKGQVEHFEAINAMREEGYKALNAAGAVKPRHDFKAQVEKMLNMIAAEQASNQEKAKTALMDEALADVSGKFASEKALKKAALDSAIASIKGSGKVSDPVKESFVKFFHEKAAVAKTSTDDSEEKAQTAALIAKLDGVAKSEGFVFDFDASGKPKMTV